MKTLNAAAAKYNSISLIVRILCGLVIGAVLALTVPGAGWVAELGTLFVGALKAIAPLLVFVLIISALAQSKEKLGKQFGTLEAAGYNAVAFADNDDIKVLGQKAE